jgi:hypothetical protein
MSFDTVSFVVVFCFVLKWEIIFRTEQHKIVSRIDRNATCKWVLQDVCGDETVCRIQDFFLWVRISRRWEIQPCENFKLIQVVRNVDWLLGSYQMGNWLISPKICTELVPENVSNCPKLRRKDICSDLINYFGDKPEPLLPIVTGDRGHSVLSRNKTVSFFQLNSSLPPVPLRIFLFFLFPFSRNYVWIVTVKSLVGCGFAYRRIHSYVGVRRSE